VDDTNAILAAVAAAAGEAIFVPDGIYKVTNLMVPVNAKFVGESQDAWFRGTVLFNSGNRFTDMKLGYDQCATRPGAAASDVLFTRVRFAGGGQTGVSWPNTSPLIIGSRYSCSYVSFIDCDVERSMGTDPTFSNGYNNVALIDRDGVHCDHISFTGGEIGVTNGTATGSPRFSVEGYTASGYTGSAFTNITFDGVTIHGGDAGAIDFSDQPSARADYITVTGCTIHGGGITEYSFGYGLCLELPEHAVITNNIFTRAWTQSLMVTKRSEVGYDGPAAIITGNTFDLTTGPAHTGQYIVLKGDYNVFTGNSIDGGGTWDIIGLWDATFNTVTGNTFTNTGDSSLVVEGTGCSDNTIDDGPPVPATEFGNETAGTSWSAIGVDSMELSNCLCDGDTNVTAINAYLRNTATGHAACEAMAVVYTDNGANTPDELVSYTSSVSITDNQAEGWVHFAFIMPVHVSGPQTYWLGVFANESGAGLQRAKTDTAGHYISYMADDYTDGPPTAYAEDGYGSTSWMSIYADFINDSDIIND